MDNRFRQKISTTLKAVRRFQSPAQDPFAAGIVALITGVITGYAALAFRGAIAFIQKIGFLTPEQNMTDVVAALPWWQVLFTPVLGGLAVALVLRFFMNGGAPHSVAEVIQANVISTGEIKTRDGLSSALVAATALGTGAPVGREGPVVHLGATLASLIAQKLKAPPAMARTLLGCGVAAAIAASFNAPLAGVFFALEVVLGSYAIASFAPIVIAAVMGTIITRIHIGDHPAFILPGYSINSFTEVPAFLILGGISALVAAGFIRAVFFADDQLARLPIPRWANPPLAGLAVGIIGLFLPMLLGVGYGATDAALKENYDFLALLVLLAAKMALTALCLSARFGTGVFSPSLFMGAMTGGAFGLVVAAVFPEGASTHGLYAIVGMGAVAGAVLGAPISTVLIVFELTGDYQITLALMAATAVASVTSARFLGPSFFKAQFRRRGLDIDEGEARLALRQIKVGDQMDEEFLILPEDASLQRVRALLARLTRGSLVVVRQSGSFVGTICPKDMGDDVTDQELDDLVRASDLVRSSAPYVLSSHSMDYALLLLTEKGEDMLPVLNDNEERRVVGVIHKTNVLMLYNHLLLEEKRHNQGD
ncbi:MAG: chloride channel protein [Sphingomonadales bacterium]|jgi:CIC family chloride channel protein